MNPVLPVKASAAEAATSSAADVRSISPPFTNVTRPPSSANMQLRRVSQIPSALNSATKTVGNLACATPVWRNDGILGPRWTGGGTE